MKIPSLPTNALFSNAFFSDSFFSDVEKGGRPLVFGHRGLSQYYPENTILSFSKCAENPKIDGIELDVHLCKSGEVVIAHDFSLKRTAGIDREIETFTYEELQQIDVGSFKGTEFSFARIPLLTELFSAFGDRFIYDVEIKSKAGHVDAPLSRKTFEIIKDFKLQDRVLVSSFNPFALRAFNRISRGVLPSADIFEHAGSIPKLLWDGAGHFVSGSSFQKPGSMQIDHEYIRKHGKRPIVTWTVNTKEEAVRLLSLNKGKMHIHGMIGNDPALLADIVSHNGC